MTKKTTLQKRFKADLLKLLAKYNATLCLTDHESERQYSMWVFFEGEEPLDLGLEQPEESEESEEPEES